MNTTIREPWGVSAFGRGDLTVEPDFALIRLALNRIDKKPGKALEAARAEAAHVRAAARALNVPDADVTSSRTSMNSVWDRHSAGRNFIGHQCRIQFAIQVRDLERVEQCLIDLVEAGADEVVSVEYDTHSKPDLRRDARKAAVAAATAKAELYAEAAGAGLGPIVHIEDVDPERLRGEHTRGGGGSGATDLAPGQVMVSAAVQLGFSLRF